MDIKQNFRNHFFFYIVAVIIFMTGAFSYYRFMINQDYIIGYEGVCDPAKDMNKCFKGCDNDDCTEVHYYSKMVKYAPDLYRECGDNIINCESASSCLSDDRYCSVAYCNSEVNGDTCAETIGSDNKDNAE